MNVYDARLSIVCVIRNGKYGIRESTHATFCVLPDGSIYDGFLIDGAQA